MNPLEKSIRRYISLKIFVMAIIFITSFMVSGFMWKQVGNGDKNIVYAESVKSYKSSVVQIFKQQEARFEDYRKNSDYVNRSKDEIYINRSIPVVIQYDGKEQRFMTEKTTVEDVLIENNIRLYDKDILEGIERKDLLYPDIRIRIVRIRSVKEICEEKIDFATKEVKNSSLEMGKKVVKVKGESGKKLVEYEILYEDGVEKRKTQFKESVIKKPIDQVVEIGTKSVKLTSKGVELNYKKALNMKATGYTASYIDTGKQPGQKGFGITYTGLQVRRGIIAVDPSVIPLGSKVYIEGNGISSDYGYAIAADIGGAIKGNKIDLYFESRIEAINWGYRNVKVYILK